MAPRAPDTYTNHNLNIYKQLLVNCPSERDEDDYAAADEDEVDDDDDYYCYWIINCVSISILFLSILGKNI